MKTTNRREGILSKTEYDIMSIIWDVNRSVSAREIYDLLPEPQPAYTTLANEMRMLYEKGFVDHFKDASLHRPYRQSRIRPQGHARREAHLLRRQPALDAQLLHTRRGNIGGGTNKLLARNGSPLPTLPRGGGPNIN